MKLLLILSLLPMITLAGPKKEKTQLRWPAQDSPTPARDIIRCDFYENKLEIKSIEVFAVTESKNSDVTLSNISTIVEISAHAGFRMLTTGGNLDVSNSSINGTIMLNGQSADLIYSKDKGATLTLQNSKIASSNCNNALLR